VSSIDNNDVYNKFNNRNNGTNKTKTNGKIKSTNSKRTEVKGTYGSKLRIVQSKIGNCYSLYLFN
jgi:hypothetical protein